MKDLFGYNGKNIVIDGAASGMGLAAAKLLVELGALVYTLDVNEVTFPAEKFIKVDLSDKGSIDNAIKQLPEKIDRIFCCAGLPGAPFPDKKVVLVNFAGHRHLIESLIPKMGQGGSIAVISSLAGMQWRTNYGNLKGLLATPSFDEAAAWLDAQPDAISTAGDSYGFSKQCLCAYVVQRSIQLVQKGIRMNSLSPASTATPMLKDFEKNVGKETLQAYAMGGRFATPEEMAEPLVFLNSHMARFITGIDLMVDNGVVAGFTIKQLVRRP